jgi:hypothetical protein
MKKLRMGKLFLWLVAFGIWPVNLVRGADLHRTPIYSGTQAIAAVTAGDFDPLHPGLELACLLANGSIMELALEASGWTTNILFQRPGFAWDTPATRVSLSVGDVLYNNPGQEIVVNIERQLIVVYYGPSGWTNQIVADLTAFVGTAWGAEIGDCDPSNAGEEIFFIFEGVLDFSFGTVYARSTGGWKENIVYNAEVGMDSVIGDSNPDVAGNEIIVVTEMGPAYEILPPPAGGAGPWPKRTIWDDFDNAGWVVKLADVDPASPGNELVYGTRYSDRILMSRFNGTNRHTVDILMTGINTNQFSSMFDVAAGQVFSASPAAEIFGVDGSGSLYLVQQTVNQWVGSVLWQDSNALYAVLTADLIPTPGNEVIAAGASGKVFLFYNPSPTLSLTLTAQQQPVLSWLARQGWTYHIEKTTNLTSIPIWSPVTNLTSGAFIGTLNYTNPEPATQAAWFRLRSTLSP